MFLVKKIVAPLLFPFTIVNGLLLLGLALLWFTKRRTASRKLITVGVAMLLLFSYATIPDLSLGLLEKQYLPFRFAQPDQGKYFVKP